MQFKVQANVTEVLSTYPLPCVGPGVYLVTAFAEGAYSNVDVSNPHEVSVYLGGLPLVQQTAAPLESGSLNRVALQPQVVVIADPEAFITATTDSPDMQVGGMNVYIAAEKIG